MRHDNSWANKTKSYTWGFPSYWFLGCLTAEVCTGLLTNSHPISTALNEQLLCPPHSLHCSQTTKIRLEGRTYPISSLSKQRRTQFSPWVAETLALQIKFQGLESAQHCQFAALKWGQFLTKEPSCLQLPQSQCHTEQLLESWGQGELAVLSSKQKTRPHPCYQLAVTETDWQNLNVCEHQEWTKCS